MILIFIFVIDKCLSQHIFPYQILTSKELCLSLNPIPLPLSSLVYSSTILQGFIYIMSQFPSNAILSSKNFLQILGLNCELNITHNDHFPSCFLKQEISSLTPHMTQSQQVEQVSSLLKIPIKLLFPLICLKHPSAAKIKLTGFFFLHPYSRRLQLQWMENELEFDFSFVKAIFCGIHFEIRISIFI